MKTKGNWVIKTSSEVVASPSLYWCGNNMFDRQLRKAQIYHWKEKAEEQAAWIWKKNKISEAVTWEIVEVSEPKELKATEAMWVDDHGNEDGPDYYCSACGFAALNDYRGRSTDSKFCPNCGKRMINSTMPEDNE